ncbi:MAG: DEAD/DEAH box helicase [Nocardioidaceae bacterium]
MPNQSATRARSQSTKFYWGEVSPTTARALLHAAYGDDHELAKRARAWTTDRLAAQLRAVFGSPPKMDKLEHWGAWDALHYQWAMKEASKERLATLVSYAMASLPVHERLDARSTLANLRAFVDGRNRTVAFKTNLRAAFIRAHKRSQPTTAGHGHGRSSPSGSVSLQGGGVPVAREAYPHQLEARRRLDALMTQTNASERRGLIVLPTGAGKTSTVVDWLVPRMAADEGVRVLWLAHQHELLEQASHAFESAALREQEDFARKMRLISSAGSATSTLAEDDLDVALVTWQSLNRSWDQHRARVRRFLNRPTVVIVDEAHHAAAPGYQRILSDVRDRPQAVLIGLTATPWPGQDGAGRRLRTTFPVDILTRTPEQMHEQGILATPVFHTVDTGQHLQLTDIELGQSKGDLAAAVLKRLVNDARDDLLVRTWTARRAHWGKTLVFATSRDHADRLGEKLHAASVNVNVAHSTSAVHAATHSLGFATGVGRRSWSRSACLPRESTFPMPARHSWLDPQPAAS